MFRFTIRDVLLGMVIVGLAVTWWLDRRSLAATIDVTTEALEVSCAMLRESGGHVDESVGVLKLTDPRGNYYVIRNFSHPNFQVRDLPRSEPPLQ